MKKLLAIALLIVPAFGQFSRSSSVARQAQTVVNYYISTGGSDSNPCTSASKCLTLAHVLTLLPPVLDRRYVINVADGTYAEPIDTSGFLGVGMGTFPSGSGTHMVSIEILGNTTTPANVVFSGTAQCDSVYTSVGCFSGSGKIILHGLTLSGATRNVIDCQGGTVEYNKVIVTNTSSLPPDNNGINAFNCNQNQEGDLTISGFDGTCCTSSAAVGLLMELGSTYTLGGGTLTITGPGPAAGGHGTTCIALSGGNNQFVVTSFTSATSIACTQVNTGLYMSGNSSFDAFGSTTISFSNSATPSGPADGAGIITWGQSSVSLAFGANLTVNHFFVGINTRELSFMGQGNSSGTRTITNNSTATTQSDSSLLKLY